MKYYKILTMDGNAPIARTPWCLPKDGKPGAWMPRVSYIEPCASGYHLLRQQDVPFWLNEYIYKHGLRVFLAEGRGKNVVTNNKVVFAQARLIREVCIFHNTGAATYRLNVFLDYVIKVSDQQGSAWSKVQFMRNCLPFDAITPVIALGALSEAGNHEIDWGQFAHFTGITP